MPDYTIGIAERIASLADSFATSNSVNRNYFQATNQSVINKVTVALAPDAPTALNPNPDTTFTSSTDGDSVDTYGQQDGPLFITLLATIEEAGELSEYLIRANPAFWFSNLAISLNTLSDANKNIVANLEIGQQIAVTKTFPVGVVPQSVTEVLFVEGISHRVTPETHVVTIYTGPATTYLQWLLGNYAITQTRTNSIINPNFEVNTTGWQVGAGMTIARTTSDFFVGTSSALVTLNNTSAFNSVNNLGQRSAATVGATYTLSSYAKLASGTAPGYRITLYFYDGAGNVAQQFNSSTTTMGSAWERKSVSGTAPVNAVTVGMALFIPSAFPGIASFYFDAIMIEQAASALSYFDGTYSDAYTGYTLTYQAWDGVANTSTSTTVWGLNSSGTGSPLNDSTYGLA